MHKETKLGVKKVREAHTMFLWQNLSGDSDLEVTFNVKFCDGVRGNCKEE